ncbi:endopeptidase La [Chakrabartyella piscis]|uniref:endopeptidase La n=1 Tax=Chakrabartyella piscis TaxID=2918914 RepID=UPI0029583B13|nr:endopeptidase La [Chakrabartyella piscis]
MDKKKPVVLPMVALRGTTLFPNMAISFPVGRQKSLDAIRAGEESGGKIFVVTQKEASETSPKKNDLYAMGVVARIKQVLKLPGNVTHVIVEGEIRGKMTRILKKSNYDLAEFETIEQDFPQDVDDYTTALMRMVVEEYEKYLKFVPNTAAVDLLGNVQSAKKPGRLADYIGAGLEVSYKEKQEILQTINPHERLEAVMTLMEREESVLQIKKDIESKTRAKLEEHQREFYLREEMKVIQEELGDKDGIGAEIKKYEEQMEAKDLPETIKDVIAKEIVRLRRIPVSSPESNVSRNYIETILALPWTECTEEKLDLQAAAEILDQDHYGLEKVKERILEYLAVRKNAPEEKPTILCLVGPPGVGKTSIAQSVAKALDRKYIRMSLGGVKDESEIRGHRKTYIGAMPGRIINAMKQVGTINPLMLLDEIDKLGVSHNGDPSAALLEVLDGEQNNTFRDHFVEVPYDLSKVLFMCTANSLDTIPRPLLDRMEVISLVSYTSQEKLEIAKNHLVARQRKRHGLKGSQLKVGEAALTKLIDGYTKEAGVRQLERVIGEVCRKTVKLILEGEKKSVTLTVNMVEELLGKEKYAPDSRYEEPQVGIVRGLAWTAVGGTTLSVEVNVMEGDGKFKLTGNVGKVMTESAETAMSYIRSQREKFGLEANFYKTKDVHIHIPEGATPKDGPSAGVTMVTAILSAFTEKEVRSDVAMTGEVTIRGRVLAIGGLQEKLLAAKKVGIKTVCIPFANEKHLAEVSDDIKEGMEIILAKTMEDVLSVALLEGDTLWK